MAASKGHRSLFSQRLDRALFATYFLGAIVPLLAAAYLVHRFALPTVEDDSFATMILLGSAVGISLLSLAAFFALRRLSISAVLRMDADNDRLAIILDASRGLGAAPHAHAAAEITAGCALRLTGADAVLVLRRLDEEKDFELCETAGKSAQSCFADHTDELIEMAECVAADRISGVPRPIGDGVGVAFEMQAEEGAPGVLIVVRSRWSNPPEVAFLPEVLDAIATLSGLAAVAVQSAELKDSQRNFFTHVTELLVMAIDSHVGQRAGGYHWQAQLANRVGREMGLDDEALRRLHFAALLADIGMLKLSEAQLRSAKLAARHPVVGHRMLSRIRLWEPLSRIVLHHHDRFDGSGSEDARRGDAIPLEARILHVADAFACLTWSADDESLLTPSRAVVRLLTGAGSEYDPEVVAAFQRLVERGEIEAAS
jgi:hypothetical protein